MYSEWRRKGNEIQSGAGRQYSCYTCIWDPSTHMPSSCLEEGSMA